jgi:exonuclease III
MVQSKLNLLLWNSRSLNLSKHVQLQLHRQHADIIGITETWNPNDQDVAMMSKRALSKSKGRIHLGGYPYSIHRPFRKGKAGVSLYSKYPLRERMDLYNKCQDVVYGEVLIPNTNTHVIIGCVYHRTDSNSSLTYICNSIRRAVNNDRHLPVIIMGDWNAHHNEWNGNRRNGNGDDLLKLVNDCNLSIINNLFHISRHKPTHIKGGVIDLIMTSHPQLFTSCTVNPNQLHLISDHHPILSSISVEADTLLIQCNQPHRPKRYRWCTDPSAADWTSFADECNNIAPRVLHNMQSIESSVVHITSTAY